MQGVRGAIDCRCFVSFAGVTHKCVNGCWCVHTSAHNDTVSKSSNAQSNRPDQNLVAKIRQRCCHRVNPNSNVTIVNESFSKSDALSIYSATRAFSSLARVSGHECSMIRRGDLMTSETHKCVLLYKLIKNFLCIAQFRSPQTPPLLASHIIKTTYTSSSLALIDISTNVAVRRERSPGFVRKITWLR